ncbi:MAG: hypothetical protein ACSLEN_02360 [Candidatus Malihini olakiniferum]
MAEKVDSKDINKHRNDVLKLVGLLSEEPVVLPVPIFQDLSQFIECQEYEEIDLKALKFIG